MHFKDFWKDILSPWRFKLIPAYWQHWSVHCTNHWAIEINKGFGTFTRLESPKSPILNYYDTLVTVSKLDDVKVTLRILIPPLIHWVYSFALEALYTSIPPLIHWVYSFVLEALYTSIEQLHTSISYLLSISWLTFLVYTTWRIGFILWLHVSLYIMY